MQYKNNIGSAPRASGYGDAGASFSKRSLQGFIASSISAVEDINFHNKTLRQRARMLTMSAPIATAAINTNRIKIVGTGLRMRCALNRDILGISDEEAKRWAKKTETEFNMWATNAKNCDALGLNNFFALQQLAVTSWLTSGDVFALFKRYAPTKMNPYSLRIHLIEADRISTPGDYVTGGVLTEGKTEKGNKIHDGVEVDKNGLVIAYHIRNTYPNQFKSGEPTTWTRIKAVGEKTGIPNILHIMTAERCDQYRGVSYLAPVIETLLQLRRYTESELVAALVQSFYTAWIITESDPTEIPTNEAGIDEIDGVGGGGSVSERDDEYEMGPATVHHLKKGENIVLGNPNIPTSGFDRFFKVMVTQASAALDLPYEVVLKAFNSSYSASKGSLEEAWEGFKMRRTWLIDDMCRPTYEAWLAEAIALGRIKAPGFFDDPLIRYAWCSSRWEGPAQTHLDPLKEAKANEIRVANGWSSNEQITREYYGGDWEDNMEALRRETKLVREIRMKNKPTDGGNKNAQS